MRQAPGLTLLILVLVCVCSFNGASSNAANSTPPRAYLPSLSLEQTASLVSGLEKKLEAYFEFWQSRSGHPLFPTPRVILLESSDLSFVKFLQLTSSFSDPETALRDYARKLSLPELSSDDLRVVLKQLFLETWFYSHPAESLEEFLPAALPESELRNLANSYRDRIEQEWLPLITKGTRLADVPHPLTDFKNNSVSYYTRFDTIFYHSGHTLAALRDDFVLCHEAAHSILARLSPKFRGPPHPLWRTLNEAFADYLAAVYLHGVSPRPQLGAIYGQWLEQNGLGSDLLPRSMGDNADWTDIHSLLDAPDYYKNGNVLRRLLWELRLQAHDQSPALDRAVVRAIARTNAWVLPPKIEEATQGLIAQEYGIGRFLHDLLEDLEAQPDLGTIRAALLELVKKLRVPPLYWQKPKCESPLIS